MTDNQSPDGLISKSEDLITQELAIVGVSRQAAQDIVDAMAGVKPTGKGKGPPYLTGLAFSGGGIRSATVSLGVMQKLAACGILKQVDYLSTVSGGGFIGSALTWWLRKRPDGSSPYDSGEKLPYGTNDPANPDAPTQPGHPPLSFLRQNGLYLTPGNGITFWSGIAVVSRTILLNLLVWVPVAAFVFLAMLLISRISILNGLPHLIATLSPRSLPALSEAVGSRETVAATDLFPPLFLLLLVVAGILAIIFLLGSFNYSLLSWTVHPESQVETKMQQREVKVTRLGWLWAAVIAVVGLALLGAVILWLLDPAKVLFDYSSSPEAKAGGLARQWPWIALLSLIGLGFVVKFEAQQWSIKEAVAALKRQQNVVFVIAAFPVLAIADAFLSVWSSDWWPGCLWPIARVSALLQFFAGICFLVFSNYWVGTAMRKVLRFVHVGDGISKIADPSARQLEYGGRRLFEIFFGKTLWLTLVLVAIGILPLLNAFIEYGLGGIEGLFAVVAGLTSTVMGHLRASSKGDSRWTNLFIMVGAGLFAYGVLLIGYRLAVVFLEGDVMQRSAIATLFTVAAVSGWFANINYIGLHRFYRDRLMEAFMPGDETVKGSANGASYDANEFRVAEAWTTKESDGKMGGPFHIVNTNVVLTNSNTRQFRQRGGDNFIITPAFVGSRATGWRAMADYANNDITLASAMAASGAAANPRGGVGGKGITRSKTVSIIMGLLNIRLGYWLRHPKATRHESFLARRPNHFWPGGFYALSFKGYREDSRWLEVSDGAHFENLAVYELIRRRCGLIIVCDGGQDNKSSYSDLVTAVQRVGEDFGVAIRFDMKVKDGNGDLKTSGPAMLVARTSKDQFPKGAEFADKGYFVATIEYPANTVEPWPKKGVLLYLKSALIESLHIKAKGYRGAHADFPNESTADQFFDEEQFEAYREVGYRICTQMVEDLGLCDMYKKGNRPTLGQIREQLSAGQAKAP